VDRAVVEVRAQDRITVLALDDIAALVESVRRRTGDAHG
jgi:hypothetical protein